MKNGLSFLLVLSVIAVRGQNVGGTAEQQLENLSAQEDQVTEDDTYWQQHDYFSRHRLNLNAAGKSELQELGLLTDLQIDHLLQYRRLLGILVSPYELQAVPGFDVETIRRLLPFIEVKEPVTPALLHDRLKGGTHKMLLRWSRQLELPQGYEKPDSGTRNYYLGDPSRMLVRYTYNKNNLLRFGITADKDAGEQWFAGKQRAGFDFYSLHLFARKLGVVQAVALGDFTVNLGQGLIQWQSLAFKKSADIAGVKRQGPVLRPYTSAGEYNFYRGAGITLQKGHWQMTGFVSRRPLNAHIETDDNEKYVTSLLQSGYNRTFSELAGRHALTCMATGGNIRYEAGDLQVGWNMMHYRFSLPLHAADQPYDWYGINGDRWQNMSLDAGYTIKNTHWYGEWAMDRERHPAFVGGLLASLDPRLDLAVVYRSVHPAYRSFFSNAFTEQSVPMNEKGLYAGIIIRPWPGIDIRAYADVFRFPWLRYRVDAPSAGKEYLLQLNVQPNKQTSIYTRFRSETKQQNLSGSEEPTHALVQLPRQGWRSQVSYVFKPGWTFRERVDIVWFDRDNQQQKQEGFLLATDLLYKSSGAFSGDVRLQYFETGGYDARLYAYERDVLFSYSVPAFFDKGFRYYFNVHWVHKKRSVSKKQLRYDLWLRFAQTILPGGYESGSGLDHFIKSTKSEAKIQFSIGWE